MASYRALVKKHGVKKAASLYRGKKTAKKAAKKGAKTRSASWRSLVKKYGVMGAKKLYKKGPKKAAKKTRKKASKTKARKTRKTRSVLVRGKVARRLSWKTLVKRHGVMGAKKLYKK